MTDKTELQHDERHTSAEVLAMMEGKPFAGGTTLELVRHWMMSGDYPPNDWERQFAAAVDAHRLATRTPDPTPVAWMYELSEANVRKFYETRFPMKVPGWTETPLYAHPPAVPADGLVEALEWYADQMCEGLCQGKDPKACAAIGADNCAGCPAVVALAAQRGEA